MHWFVSDPVSTVSRPVKELKHFEKQFLKKGETKTFSFDVDLVRDFGFVDTDGNRSVEPGTYYVTVKDKQVKIEVEE